MDIRRKREVPYFIYRESWWKEAHSTVLAGWFISDSWANAVQFLFPGPKFSVSRSADSNFQQKVKRL